MTSKVREGVHPSGFSYIIATADFAPGELIVSLGEEQTDENDPRRLQLSATRFLLPPQTAHLCEPTAYIDWRDLALRALRPIRTSDTKDRSEIGYHFATSEWNYRPFDCLCGSLACIGRFSGCAAMSPESLATLDAYYQQLSSGLPDPPEDFFSLYIRTLRQNLGS